MTGIATVKKPQATKTAGAQRQPGTAIGKIEPVKASAAVADIKPKKPFNPAKFAAEVRQEAKRITWTSRKEVWITTVMVVLMVVLASTFLWAVDAAFGYLLSALQNALHG